MASSPGIYLTMAAPATLDAPAGSQNETPSPSEPQGQTATQERPQTHQQVEQLPPYNVVLLNDDDHTYEYVIEMLLRLFGIEPGRGFLMAKMVDAQGRVNIVTTHKELAELRRDQIHAFGRDQRIMACKGSMSAIIEPAFGGDDVPDGKDGNAGQGGGERDR